MVYQGTWFTITYWKLYYPFENQRRLLTKKLRRYLIFRFRMRNLITSLTLLCCSICFHLITSLSWVFESEERAVSNDTNLLFTCITVAHCAFSPNLFQGQITQISINQMSSPENKKCSLWKVFGINHPQTLRFLSRRVPRGPGTWGCLNITFARETKLEKKCSVSGHRNYNSSYKNNNHT